MAATVSAPGKEHGHIKGSTEGARGSRGGALREDSRKDGRAEGNVDLHYRSSIAVLLSAKDHVKLTCEEGICKCT